MPEEFLRRKMMQAVSEKNYSKIFVPNRGLAMRFKFEENSRRMKFTDDEFWEFCCRNDKMRIEMTKEGDVIIMPPTGFETSDRNAELTTQRRIWAKKDKRGVTADSNGGFILPNGATRSPDSSWILKSRLETLSKEALQKFLPLCPDFVVEMTSPSDSLNETQEK